MVYKVKITYKVINLKRGPGSSIMNKGLKKYTCLNLYNRYTDILIN